VLVSDESTETAGTGQPSDSDNELHWDLVSADAFLSRPPVPGSPGNVSAGQDLRLDIGWDWFEQLMTSVAQDILGLNQVQFRRYGTSGQAQHGIDLAGRGADGAYTVVQCKEYETFTPTHLRAAVTTFVSGKRPFASKHFIVAVSTVTRTTQLEDELAALQDQHTDLRLELWGAEQINEVLRDRADIVSRFWTRETADTFCTGAPLPGVAAPPLNWMRVADQILLSPLGVDGLDEQLAAADRLRTSDPAAAADKYQQLADTLAGDGFSGHAHLLRRRQLDALAQADQFEAVAALTASLAATALHEADVDQAEQFRFALSVHLRDSVLKAEQNGQDAHASPGIDPAQGGHAVDPAVARHAELVDVALSAVNHPLGDVTALATTLRDPPNGLSPPRYQPLLVLLLAELTAAAAVTAPSEQPVVLQDPGEPAVLPAVVRLAELDDLLTSALSQLDGSAVAQGMDKDVAMRLRLFRAHYDVEERTTLLSQARQLRLPRTHAALVLAAQARRDALDGAAIDALEHWRQAVGHAIHEGRTDDAAGWLYAIRAANINYGPWTDRLDEEHLLAQALPKTGSGGLIRRVRSPETDALRAALAAQPVTAIRAARRWLSDSIVTGDLVGEQAAAELLGDLYAGNTELERAAACYQWGGCTKKVTDLAAAAGDRVLPPTPIGSGPWWQQSSSLAVLAAQHDLLDDDTAGRLLTTLLDTVARGRAGHLVDNPTHSLLLQATKTACVLAGRGTCSDAQALLDLLAGDVARDENQYQYHDKQHVQACESIAMHHPELAWPAVQRIFDLAQVGTDEALHALNRSPVVELLRDPKSPDSVNHRSISPAAEPSALTARQRRLLLGRLQAMAAAGRYEAGVTVAALGGTDQAIVERATQARDRLLRRSEPDGLGFGFGGRMVPDAYLVTFLSSAEQQKCLDNLLAVAADRREAAPNRQEALAAAANLVLELDDEIKAEIHITSRPFAEGHQDGSFLDAETTNPHPLSFMKINLGTASLRAAGLHLARCSAVTEDDRMWVRQCAVDMLASSDERLVGQGAKTLSSLGEDLVGDLDAALLSTHRLPIVRQLAAIVAPAAPARYAKTLGNLATDPDSSVRRLLAERLHKALQSEPQTGGAEQDHQRGTRTAIIGVLDTLQHDLRHNVRRAATGCAGR
jgi:hypothetical protein